MKRRHANLLGTMLAIASISLIAALAPASALADDTNSGLPASTGGLQIPDASALSQTIPGLSGLIDNQTLNNLIAGGTVPNQIATGDPTQTIIDRGIESAQAIELNKATTGKMTLLNPMQWYKVTLPGNGRFQLNFGGDYATLGRWDITMIDSGANTIFNNSHSASDNMSGKVTTELVTGLPAGTYYLRIVGVNVNDLAYTITPLFSQGVRWEAEINDDPKLANSIATGKKTQATLTTRTDEDWYQVKLRKAGRFQISFGGDYASQGRWLISLRDASNQELWSGYHSASDNLSGKSRIVHTTGLPAGTYYLRISDPNRAGLVNSGLENLAYVLTPKFKASSAWETELNDSAVVADSMPFGKTVLGTMKNSYDEDWFKIKVAKAGNVQVKFSGASASSGSWQVTLRNKNGESVASGYYTAGTTKTKSLFTKKLKKGTYYVRVFGAYSANLQNLTYKMTPTYYVPKASLKTLEPAKKALKVTWAKASGITKYQIRYATKSSMKDARVVSASKKATAKTIEGLKAGGKYYVQVRAVKKIAGTSYYSSWSAKKSAKTK